MHADHAVVGGFVDVRATLHADLHRLEGVGLRGTVLGRRTLRIPEAETRRRHERGDVLDCRDAGVRPVREQEAHQRHVAAFGRQPERRGPYIAQPGAAHPDVRRQPHLSADFVEGDFLPCDAGVRVGAVIEQRLGQCEGLRIAERDADGPAVQRQPRLPQPGERVQCRSPRIRGVRVGAVIDQPRREREVAVQHRQDQRRGANGSQGVGANAGTFFEAKPMVMGSFGSPAGALSLTLAPAVDSTFTASRLPERTPIRSAL